MWRYSFLFIILTLGLHPSGDLTAQPNGLKINVIDPSTMGVVAFRDYPEYAAIIIISSLNDLQISTNSGPIIENLSEPSKGIYRVIIEPKKQTLTISQQGSTESTIEIPDLSPRDVLYFRIESVQSMNTQLPVYFDLFPEQANLIVNEKSYDQERFIQLEEGVYSVRVEKDGYVSQSLDINVSLSNTLFSIKLEEIETHPIVVTSIPEGANVYLNDILRGVTPFTGYFIPNTYALRVSKNGFRSSESQITISEDVESEIHVELEKVESKISIQIDPSDAIVYLNGRQIDSQGSFSIPPGLVRIEVEKDGYESYSDNFTLLPEQSVERIITLKKNTGAISLDVTPSNATIEVRNVKDELIFSSKGSSEIENIKPGTYVIRMSLEGYLTTIRMVTIKANETISLNAELEQATQSASNQNTRSNDVNSAIDPRLASGNSKTSEMSEPVTKDPRPKTYVIWYLGSTYTEDYVFNSFDQPIYDGYTSAITGLMFVGRMVALDIRGGASLLNVHQSVQSSLDYPDQVLQLYGSASFGPKIRLGPLDFFALGGISTAEYNLGELTNEQNRFHNDTFYELSVHIGPGRGKVGLKYSYRKTYDLGIDTFVDSEWHHGSIIFKL